MTFTYAARDMQASFHAVCVYLHVHVIPCSPDAHPWGRQAHVMPEPV